MAGAIDPNLWVSLARQWLGGMLAPSAGQAGYFARVNTEENNIEYVRPDVALAEVGLYTSAGIEVGTRKTYHGQITTTDTATHTILSIELPIGQCDVEIFVSGFAAGDGDYRLRLERRLYHVTSGSITGVSFYTAANGGTLTGTSALATSGQNLLIQCTSAAGDGSTAWTASARVTRHGV